MSQAEISLEELNKEINEIVKSNRQNDTSYFPNIQKVLQAFESYLECLESDLVLKKESIKPRFDCFVFKQKVDIKILSKFQRFLHSIINWDFDFNDEFKSLIMDKTNRINPTSQIILSELSAIQIVFLMYLCLEVERKEIIGKEVRIDQNRMFMLREITNILEDFYQTDDSDESAQEQKPFNLFAINEEKLLHVIMLKTLRLKLQKQNFNFTAISKIQSKFDKKPAQYLPKKIQEEKIQKNNSLVSVQSEFESSLVFEKKVEKLRKDLAVLPVKVEAERIGFKTKNLSNEEIFKNISLKMNLYKY